MSAAVDRFTQEYFDLTFAHSPVTATEYGVHDRDAELDDIDAAGMDDHVRRIAGLRARVLAVDAVDEEEAVDRDALAAALAGIVFTSEVERPWRRNPHTAAATVGNSVLALLTKDFAPREQRMAHAAARLEQAPRLLSQAKRMLDEPCPHIWRDMAVAAARASADFLPAALASQADGTPVAARAVAAAQTAAAALGEYAQWLETEHSDRFPQDAPYHLGPDALARRLREVHCLDRPPEDFAALGHQQIAEISEQLAEQAGRLGSDDWRAKLDEITSRHPTREGLVDAYRQEMAALAAFVFDHDVVGNPRPQDPVVTVEATPEFRRAHLPMAAYENDGPFEQRQNPAVVVTPPRDDSSLRDHGHGLLQSIAAHEGYPGHHLQITTANQLGSLTRRAIYSHVMIEGWGLYAEELMHTLGYYDEEARMGQLSMRLLRALRCVLDMEVQAGETTWEEGVAKAVSLVGMSEPNARSEVMRNTAMPTHPFGFLVGCLELERLRTDAQHRLGDAFTLRSFHDQVLSYGHLPPTLIARAMAATASDPDDAPGR